MSPMNPTTSRRGTQLGGSHLRQVSSGSADSDLSGSGPGSRPVSSTGTAHYDPIPTKLPFERRCNLWVHDDVFSKDEVVLNLDLFPGVVVGDLLTVVALKTDSGVRDFQELAHVAKKDTSGLGTAMKRERSSSNPRSPSSGSGNLNGNGTDVKHDVVAGKRYLFIAKDMSKEQKAKHSGLEISVAKQIADVFSLKHRSNVVLTLAEIASNSASHVEMSFKDEYLARSDMWRLAVGDLSNKTVYKGQKILFMGTIKAQVTGVYLDGSKVQSAFFSTTTKPIFRSESARYVLFIQMSREMWDFDSEGSGEIMFNKVINGFLPALFKKWQSLKAKHLVSIVLFTRVEYDTGLTSELAANVHDRAYHTGIQLDANKKPYKDFYRVVVSEMSSTSWTTILYELKREFKFFRKDISMHRIDNVKTNDSVAADSNSRGALGTRIEAQPSLAMHGNVLEAINLASSQFAHDYIDRDLMRTGISIVVITPSPGLFEVDSETLRLTTETLIGNGIGIDLVCLPKMPLHSVPLFRYRNPQYAEYQESMRFGSLRSGDNTPRQNPALFGSSYSSLNESLSPTKLSLPDRTLRSGSFQASEPPSEWSFAIPHWIDVSFWTGAKQDLGITTKLMKPDSKYLRRFKAQRTPDFAVRCKMYELEMASVMENSMTEISVPPLQNDAILARLVTGSEEVVGTWKAQTGLLKRRRVHSALHEGTAKMIVDRHLTSEEKSIYKALDAYDLAKSEVMEDAPITRRKSDAKLLFKTNIDDVGRKLLAEDQKKFSTSFTDDASTSKGLGFLAGPTSAASKTQTRGNLDEIAEPPTDSIASTMTAKTPSRTPKFGRQISLGKFGFGIAPPKATTTELQIENVNAARAMTVIGKSSDKKQSPTSVMATHLFTSATSQSQERPSSSRSEQSRRTATPPPESRFPSSNGEKTPTPASRPMMIRSALQSQDSPAQMKSRSALGSFYEGFEKYQNTADDAQSAQQSMRAEDSQKVYNSKLLAGSVAELPTTLSPTTALSPWLTVLNPSNTASNAAVGPSQYRRWQHVFPKPIPTKTMKWKSLCSPASVPLTTEYFPSKYQLETEYQQKPYNISQNVDDDMNEVPKTREEFLRELIGLRLSQGFQIVVGPAVAKAFGQKSMKIANVFERDGIADDGVSVFMSMGNIIHQLSCVNGTEIEVNMFLRKPTALASGPASIGPTSYNPAIRTALSTFYESRKIVLGKPKDEYNWNYVDTFIAGFDEEMSENLRFWRARFVLIPVERPTQLLRHQGEDNEEEVRLEGIKKLTQMWQRHRVVTASERRFQTLASRKTKDPNPLDIVYKTEDPSVVVTAELETLPLIEGEGGPRRRQLLESERFRKAKLDVIALAEAIQAPVDVGGVRMQNRLWHFRLHYNCFIGSDMTTWLIENFEDIDTREEAVELGNILMANDDVKRENSKDNLKDGDNHGIFVHVEKRHPFRDGQYFYQVTGDFAKQRPESRSGWFGSRRRDNSVPSTPMSENMRESPRPDHPSRSSSNHEADLPPSGNNTPTAHGFYGKDYGRDRDRDSSPGSTHVTKKPKVALSKVMKYDVDHRKRSYRPERINLHYDRLHNPDNCYHIRIDWMSVTAKLIEDAIESWATTAERYGLRLVEAPIGEACKISSIHPFRSPYAIKLAVQPPDQQPRTYFNVDSFSPQTQSPTPSSRYFYHKALMKKFNFVLDIEAARNFPSNVEVTYSWGRPDYKYSQYIHRTGVVLAQITDDGNFLLLANRLYNNRTPSARDQDRYVKVDHGNTRIPSTHTHDRSSGSPFSSPALRPTIASYASPLLRPAVTNDVVGPQALASARFANLTTPETVKNELESFCHNAASLEAFYKEILEKTMPAPAIPNLRSPFVLGLDSTIPTLGLPPGNFAQGGQGFGGREQGQRRDPSPGSMKLSSMTGVGSPMLQMGRRPSVQLSTLPFSLNDTSRNDSNSPRGSIADGDGKI